MTVPFPAPQDPHFSFIDLFAGIGGFRIALQSLGGICTFSSEWDKAAALTYARNFGETPEGDITREEVKARIPKTFDILCGGFPCQAFSISGKQRGFADTRGTLFFDIETIARHHQPKILFLENVKNLVRHDGGRTLKIIVSQLEAIGYDVFYQLYNTSDFGLPQNRERVYFVAIRKELSAQKPFRFPEPSYEPTSLSEVLEREPNQAKIIEREDIVLRQQECHEDELFQGYRPKPNRPIQIGKVGKGGQGERIYDPYGHAITLSAHGGGVGSKTGLYLIEGKVRKLSPRECARLQGFPDEYKLHSSTSQAYQQLGNSVSINVLKHIAREFLIYLN